MFTSRTVCLIFPLISSCYGLTSILGDFASGKLNNACPTFLDYYLLLINPRCYFNPDVTSNFGIIMDNHFETYQKHSITTEDGYIINLFRIPRSNPKGVIIMQNPVISDGIVYIGTGNTSYAYYFHRQGYEVWISSTRGTNLSPNHVTLNQKDNKYWDWSYDETGVYDTRSVINYVRNKIGSTAKLIYLGYSQSGGEALIYSSLYPDEAKQNVDLFLLMAPATIFANTLLDRIPLPIYKAIGDIILFLLGIIRSILGILHREGIVQEYSIESVLVRNLAIIFPDKKVVFTIVKLFTGYTPLNDDPPVALISLQLVFRGTSIKNIIFYVQHAFSREFTRFDYGRKKNLQLYGTAEPPKFPLENITAPMYIFGGAKDFFTTKAAINMVSTRVPKTSQIYGGPQFVENFDHIDFAVGKERVRFYKMILEIFKKVS